MSGDKTEAPTPRRLRKAREEGESAVSAYAGQAVAFLVAVALAPALVRVLAATAARELATATTGLSALASSPVLLCTRLIRDVVVASVPLVLAAGAAGAIVAVAQTGGVVASKRVSPRLDRLDLVANLKGLFSGQRLFAVARALVAGAAVAWLAYAGIADHVLDLARLAGAAQKVPAVVAELAGSLVWQAALVGLALGAADVAITRRAWLARHRMSKEEVRRDYKESEGDPHLKAARARAYNELVAQATLANVKKASVVVVNPTHLACALRYDEAGGDQAPVVVATGEGDLAARILQAAREAGVPVVRDVPLARALAELAVGAAIPDVLYEAVAEILREIWNAEN